MNEKFEKEILEGLSEPQKRISSKYFYDDNGSRIFKEIMDMPEYYLTRAEFEILSEQGKEILESLSFSRHFNILELGAGDGSKTFELLAFLEKEGVDFTYIPIDISAEAINMLSSGLKQKLPHLDVKPMVGDYFEIMSRISAGTEDPSLVLFLGGNIGNYSPEEGKQLLDLISRNMHPKDKLMMGIDLQKNPRIIHNAYDDQAGITKRFNLNLLVRMNRELHTDFNTDQFDFYCYYNPRTGALYSYLISLREQKVFFPGSAKEISFLKDELIWTEQSKKYTKEEIIKMAEGSGIVARQFFMDSKGYFTDCIMEKI